MSMANSPETDARDSLEILPCLLCGGQNCRPVYQVSDRLQARFQSGQVKEPETYHIVACSACGFRFLNPRPRAQDLGKYHQGGAYGPHQREGGGAVGVVYRLLRPFSVGYKARQATRGLAPGDLLDVGCGTGEFLREMRRRGWQTLGIEKEEKAAQIARDSGCPVLSGDPLETDLSNRTFDLITLWHSLEHLPDPIRVLAKLTKHLRSLGRLVIALPNPDSLDARFYRSRWAAWDAPRHLYHFRPGELERLVRQSSGEFRLIKTASLPLDPFYHALLSEISWSHDLSVWAKAIRGSVIGLLSFFSGFAALRGSSNLYIYQKA